MADYVSQEREGKRDVSRPGLTHTHTHRSVGYALSHQIQTAHVSQRALSPSSPLTEAGARRNKLSSYMRGEIPKRGYRLDSSERRKRLSCGYGTANCSANSLLTGVGSRTM